MVSRDSNSLMNELQTGEYQAPLSGAFDTEPGNTLKIIRSTSALLNKLVWCRGVGKVSIGEGFIDLRTKLDIGSTR